MEQIRNIVFDLGGVVIDLDRGEAVRRLEALGLSEADEMLGLYRQQEPFLGLETGRLTAAEWTDELLGVCVEGVSATDLQEAFNGFLVGIPVERLCMLRKLRDAGYRLYVLSNTNPVMYHSWISEAFRQEGKRIHDYFDGVVTSFEEGMCKPDPALFQRVLDRYGLKGEETLLLDDSEANCLSASGIGIRTVRIGKEDGTTMLDVGSRLLSERNVTATGKGE